MKSSDGFTTVPCTTSPQTGNSASVRKSRLVLVHDSIGGTTGMGRVTAEMARVALGAGWTVKLVGLDVDEAFPNTDRLPIARSHRLPSLVANLFWAAAVYRQLSREDLSDAVVHVHAPLLMPIADLFTCHHLAEAAARHGLSVPVRDFASMMRSVQRVISVKVDSFAYRRRPSRTRLTFVSQFLRDEFTELYGAPLGGEILPPPAPPWDPILSGERESARARLEIVPSDVVVGYFGGDDARKGLSDVLQLAQNPKYVVLGAGPKSERVWFGRRLGLGYVNVRGILAACDVVIAPTLFDAAPVAVLEAVSAGVPVVTGVSSGWAESLERFGAGTAVRPGESLAEAIDSVVPGSLTAAEAFTANYSREALATALEQLWSLLA